MKLHTDQGNFQSLKALISAKFASVNIQKVSSTVAGDNIVSYLSKKKLPVLETDGGNLLFSANTAAKYIVLKGKVPFDEEAVDDVLAWESEDLLPNTAAWLLNKKDQNIIAQLTKTLQQSNKVLGTAKFFTGETVSVADICVFCTLLPLVDTVHVSSQDNLKRFCTTMQSLAVVKAVLKDEWEGQGADVIKASLSSQRFPQVAGAQSSSSSSSAAGPKAATPSVSSVASEEQAPVVKVSQEEIDTALKAWSTDHKDCMKPRPRQHPILPDPKSRNLLITSALPYVNNVPHLGNIIGCVLSADVFSRFARLRNYNCIYVSGTDEYGTATETKAIQEGVTPQEICDKYNKLHREIYDWFNIDFDSFGRTTTPQQTEIAQDIFWKLYNNGYVLKDSIDQLYCDPCKKFLADRFVEGTCPMCQFDDARGDQCDGCGKLINAVDLINPKCKMCKALPKIRSTEHLFVDLPKLEPQLKAHLNKVYESGTWTHNAKVITNSWIRDGLKPRCISRDLKWGTKVPLEGYTDKVFYVWFDAPIGYISITANYTDQWKQWWQADQKVEMYNFLGKDNVPFHSVIFPSCLLGANDNYTAVTHMIATEYLNYEDTKFSKSRGSGVFGDQAKDTGIPADIYRFYLLFVRPESADTAFSWDDFLLKNNSELLNNLGNFINRALMFLGNSYAGTIQPMDVSGEDDSQLLALISREIQGYVSNLEACKLRDGIRNTLSISRLGNQYMQSNKPWVLCKGSEEDKKRAGSVVSLCANISCLISVLLQPYMPATSATIQEQLQAPASVNVISGDFVAMLQPGHKIGKPSPLFQKIEASFMGELKAKFAGKPADKPAVKKGARPASSGGPAASSEEVARLTKAVETQGLKVRELKTAKAEKAVITAEVATLLKLKKELEAASSSAPASASPEEITRLTKAVETQGLKVRELKTAKAEKAVITAEVATLLKLKKELEAASSSAPAAASPEEIARLTKAVEAQGLKVRELKTAKAEKPVVDAEVLTLLKLKKELAAASGEDPSAAGKKAGKEVKKETVKDKKPAKADSGKAAKLSNGASGECAESPEVARLTKAVAEQGLKVREVKAAKPDKSVVDAEVATLLQLKRELAIAQGLDPDAVVGGGKKKGKK